MAIDDFVPEIWSANLTVHLRSSLVYGQPQITNRNYEGDIAAAGDTVNITTITDPSVSTYSGTVNYSALSDSNTQLVIDHEKYFGFKVDDIEKRQALPGYVEEATKSAGYKLAEAFDTYLSGVLYAGVNGTSNDLGSKTADISDNSAYGILVDLRTTLTRDAVPAQGRWVVVPPELYAALLQDNRFVDASASGSTDALRNGFVGRAAGFDVYESNTVPTETTGVYSVIAGHPMACTVAEQINKVEALRLIDTFGDGIRGLHVAGAKVVYPEALALASVTIQA